MPSPCPPSAPPVVTGGIASETLDAPPKDALGQRAAHDRQRRDGIGHAMLQAGHAQNGCGAPAAAGGA